MRPCSLIGKRSVGTAIRFLIVALVFSACSSLPPLLELNPNIYEDSEIRIEYRIGTLVHYIKITNKTDKEVFLHPGRSSIISSLDQTRNLNLAADDNHIPPLSSLVLTSGVLTFAGIDIDAPFRRGGRWENRRAYFDEIAYLRQSAGQSIRLFLPLTIGAREEIYDIRLVVDGVSN